ncbi:MAG: saccharopine dehydrogenase NADP-binding domain-containing protein [Myxococcota bacterium]|nr:saccharopine dehydrogenase NADP-binding domain-containing protein [Myxococcota bacterium]
MAAAERNLDLVLHGATGFTGRLVAEYLLQRYGGPGESLRWALSGRSREKLERVRDELGRETGVAGAKELPLVVADAADAAAMEVMAARTRVVCTTVGPYAKYGSKLVAACAASGTHYCDLTGEVHWMRRMIDAHREAAEASGARIVHTCGFDSIPSDLGVLFVQREMRIRHDAVSPHVKLRVKGASGGMSGGTAASMLNMLEEAQRDPSVRRAVADPYALNPEGERTGPDGPDPRSPAWDEDFDSWTAPFLMGAINTRIVRRTNALREWAYGRDFRYDEAMLTGSGPAGWAKAAGISAGTGAVMAAGTLGPLRALLGRALPKPGEGPSREAREKGYFDLRLLALHPTDPGKNVRARVTGDRDPGYGSTAKMLAESAVCLAKDVLPVGGGFWTPASAMGEALLDRLQAHAGLVFAVESR